MKGVACRFLLPNILASFPTANRYIQQYVVFPSCAKASSFLELVHVWKSWMLMVRSFQGDSSVAGDWVGSVSLVLLRLRQLALRGI